MKKGTCGSGTYSGLRKLLLFQVLTHCLLAPLMNPNYTLMGVKSHCLNHRLHHQRHREPNPIALASLSQLSCCSCAHLPQA